ncbi:hypothetical protein HDU93_003030, partial [Gonapodya sp. JEL0774]
SLDAARDTGNYYEEPQVTMARQAAMNRMSWFERPSSTFSGGNMFGGGLGGQGHVAAAAGPGPAASAMLSGLKSPTPTPEMGQRPSYGTKGRAWD